KILTSMRCSLNLKRPTIELQEIPEELSQLKEFYELCKNLSRISDIYHIQKEINLAADFKYSATRITKLVKIIDKHPLTTIYFTNENGGQYDGNFVTTLVYDYQLDEINRWTKLAVEKKNSYQLKQDVALLTNIDRLTEEMKKLKQRSVLLMNQLRQDIVQYKDTTQLTQDIINLRSTNKM
ncbi:hypothetical protein MN116_000348, partial [Schistosoma mekongi]